MSSRDAFGAVHVVCDNAGAEAGANVADIPVAAWEWVLGVDLWGVLRGCRTFLPPIREQGEGHMVNTGSLEIELRTGGEDIGVSLLAPGVVATRMPDAERNRPEGVPSTEDGPLRHEILESLRTAVKQVGMDPADVAGMVVDAIRHRRFFVLTHPENANRGDCTGWRPAGRRARAVPRLREGAHWWRDPGLDLRDLRGRARRGVRHVRGLRR